MVPMHRAYAEHLKTHHAPVMRAIHGEIRRHPGGYQELARATGRAPQSLINQFSPNEYGQAPALCTFLDVIEAIGAVAAVNAVAGLADCAAVPVLAGATLHLSPIEHFLRVSKEAGDVLAEGAADLADGRFAPDERVRMIHELDDLIAAAVAARAALR